MPDRIRWGIMSTARIGQTSVIPAIQRSQNGIVAAIASRNLARAQSEAQAFDIPRAYGAYEQLLADPNVDAIYLPLPVSEHAGWAIRCAHAGKPVLCEKPLAASAAEAREMVRVFAQHQVLLADGFMYRFHPLTQRVLQMVREGAIGDLQMVRTLFHVQVPSPDDIRLHPETGGGAVRDVGCYCIDFTRLIVGEEPDEIITRSHWGEASHVDEFVAGLLHFPSGIHASFACSLNIPFELSYDLSGSTGTIVVQRGGMVTWGGELFSILLRRGRDEEQTISVPEADPYLLMVEDFAEALLQGRPTRFPVTMSLGTLDIIDEILRQGP